MKERAEGACLCVFSEPYECMWIRKKMLMKVPKNRIRNLKKKNPKKMTLIRASNLQELLPETIDKILVNLISNHY